jgi:hypothetical protein
MILANANVDEKSYPKVDPKWLMDNIGDLCPSNLYISLVARDELIKPLVRKTKDGIFIRLILPYDEILTSEDPKSIIIDTLMAVLPRLKRYPDLIDVDALKRDMEERFELAVAL